MEPKKEMSDYDLNEPGLDIFSNTIPQTTKKNRRQELLNNIYIRTGITLALLLFLFGSTFFIASRIKRPSFEMSSADVGYIPEAKINIPQPKKYKSCSEIGSDNKEASFLYSFCQGNFCNNNQDKETCESVDVLTIKDGFLSEETGQDGIEDCIWMEEEESCKPKY